jgi:hypothetical protein
MDLTTEKTPVSPLFNVPTSTAALAPTLPAPTGNTPAPGQPQEMATPQLQNPDAQPKKHGAIHNILATLGDFLLSATGLDGVIKKRQLNEAMQGFDQDPVGTISHVSKIDYSVGAKLRDQYIDNQRLAASQASTIESRNARLAQAQQAQDQRTRGYTAAMLGSMASWDDTKRQQFYPQMRQQVINAAAKQGLDLSAELPEKFDPVALDAYIDGAVPVGTQRSQKLTQDRNEASNKVAVARVEETGRHNQATEDLGQARLGETARHNQTTEGQGAARIAKSGSSGGRVKPISSYTADDGRKMVMMSDGSERASGKLVRPPAKSSVTKPTEGMRRVINGATYEWRGGKAVRVS